MGSAWFCHRIVILWALGGDAMCSSQIISHRHVCSRKAEEEEGAKPRITKSIKFVIHQNTRDEQQHVHKLTVTLMSIAPLLLYF